MSSCGRFDLLVNQRSGMWQAIDWNLGQSVKCVSRRCCERWCEFKLRGDHVRGN